MRCFFFLDKRINLHSKLDKVIVFGYTKIKYGYTKRERMKVKTRKIANSIVITIPKSLGVPRNVEYEPEIEKDGTLVFRPIQEKTVEEKKHYTITQNKGSDAQIESHGSYDEACAFAKRNTGKMSGNQVIVMDEDLKEVARFKESSVFSRKEDSSLLFNVKVDQEIFRFNHMVISGEMSVGKTTLTRSIIEQNDEIDFIVLDGKRVEYGKFKDYDNVEVFVGGEETQFLDDVTRKLGEVDSKKEDKPCLIIVDDVTTCGMEEEIQQRFISILERVVELGNSKRVGLAYIGLPSLFNKMVTLSWKLQNEHAIVLVGKTDHYLDCDTRVPFPEDFSNESTFGEIRNLEKGEFLILDENVCKKISFLFKGLES